MKNEKKFKYLVDKIEKAEFRSFPYKHIMIEDIFSHVDFDEIIESEEITLNSVNTDDELFNELFEKNYRIIKFPGCIEDKKEYINWHKNKNKNHTTNTSCEGFGMVLRLAEAKSKIIKEIKEFLESDYFIESIANKFSIDSSTCTYDAGIQKYLDGYEISPHPDIRKKALTYMVNINPSKASEEEGYHTNYLSFKRDRTYINDLWKSSSEIERCWVPWDWCKVEVKQEKNNSIVIFSPDNNTMHAVKASYNHLDHQRTQLYGNLWYKESKTIYKPEWENIENADNIDLTTVKIKTSLLDKIKTNIPRSVRDSINSSLKPKKGATHSNRKF